MQASPSVLWHTLDHGVARRPMLTGLDAVCHAGWGDLRRVTLRRAYFARRTHNVLTLDKLYSPLTDAKLRQAAQGLHERFRLHRDTAEDLNHAFALVREVAFRQIGEKPFGVQVMGAFALAQGCIAEMATGEGKTLAATLPATVAGWRGRGCHIITVNDYLARRDAEWMGGIYRFCGLRVGIVGPGMPVHDRQQAYSADITYTTNKEVSADFLRDRITLGTLRSADVTLSAHLGDPAPFRGRSASATHRVIQRGLHYGIVDEADSVLIDEAVTPLIISGSAPNKEQLQAYQHAATLASSLTCGIDYNVMQRHREIELTPRGQDVLAELTRSESGLWQAARRREELVIQALTAKEFYQRDKHYVIQDDKVVIVDDFTGRLMPDRSWRDGLHQAVEAKESLELTPIKDTYARISFQRFFRLYHHLSGMSGTAREAAREFWQVYHLPVVVIPPNTPCPRKRLPDWIAPTDEKKWDYIVADIQHMHAQGRPVLIGTRSVHTSEQLSRHLKAAGLSHSVLNAVRHQEEAHIVAEAGQAGHITVATNMAGRGTDIKLGRSVAERGGLHVISAEKNESARIDRQLFGRCARQGDPGSCRSIASFEDELVRRHAGQWRRLAGSFSQTIRSRRTAALPARMAFHQAQKQSQRLARRRRKDVMKTDHWLEEHLSFATDW